MSEIVLYWVENFRILPIPLGIMITRSLTLQMSDDSTIYV